MLFKRNVSFLVISCVLLISCQLFGQDSPGYMYLDEEEDSGEDIYTGFVVVSGELIHPPYILSIIEDTVCINEIRVDPPRFTEMYDTTRTDTAIMISEMTERCKEDFLDYFHQYGGDQAMTMIEEKYKDNPLISNMGVWRDEKGHYFISFHHVTGDIGNVDLRFYKEVGDSLIEDRPVDSPEFIASQNAKRVNNIKTVLRKGVVIFFDRGSTIIFREGEMATVMSTLTMFANDELTYDQALAAFSEGRISIVAKRILDDVAQHKDSWK